MEITGGVLFLAIAITWRCVDVYRNRQRKRVEQRLADDFAALLAKRS